MVQQSSSLQNASLEAAKPSWTEKDLSAVLEKLLKAQATRGRIWGGRWEMGCDVAKAMS